MGHYLERSSLKSWSPVRHPQKTALRHCHTPCNLKLELTGTNSSRKRRPCTIQCKASNQEGNSSEVEKAPAASSVLSFLCPLLKLVSGGDAAAPRNRFLEVASTGFSSLARQPWGSQVRTDAVAARKAQPAKRLQVYEFEACPFCRRVRESLTELDLEAEIYPCPKDSVRHRAAVGAKGGKEMFPYLVDPNTGEAMYESSDIVKYLFRTYGGGADPTRGLLESTLVTGWVPTLLRAGRGMTRYPKAPVEAPGKMLELYSYENNQFARLVREALCELELPYILHNTGKGSAGRAVLLQLKGNTQVPYLVDPNTATSVGDSEEIVKYLFKTYGQASTPAPVQA
ncbi:hypothetical protein KFL_005140070 [Klebsormidium nitens]|uniref:GST N-terminal domain-containing protein n=1 Tax=Klebsormidium nitens TaxID=105231 RepID=A0A1Y1IFG7_KLENI|nr:hypothetical protein KFL_005140070 [Klebsormidium nitens]|eukprot:GAQ89363.1 hypothetical protein KFL_005140070 [Klebsormidium nitens]